MPTLPSPAAARPASPAPSPPRCRAAASRAGFRADIEGLRGVAVLLVVLYHVGVPGFTGGFVGVDVFFVLSGYLITGLLVDEYDRTGRISLGAFYARRARRLLPAAAVLLAATLLAGLWLLPPAALHSLALTAAAAAGYVSNLWFIVQEADYAAAATRMNPLLHTWTLGVEEQFYLVWPFLVLLALRRGGGRRGLLAGLGVVTAASFALSAWATARWQPLAFYASPARAWEFALGGLAAVAGSGVASDRGWRRDAVSALGLAAVVVAGVALTDRMPFPGVIALLPVAGTVAILAAGRGDDGGRIGRALSLPPLRLLGRVSYSWYLWHWPAIVFAAWLFPAAGGTGRLAAAALSLPVAGLGYAWVENPARFHPRLVRRTRRSLALAALLTAVLLAASGAVVVRAAAAARSPEQAAFSRAASDAPALPDPSCLTPVVDRSTNECAVGDGGRVVVLFGDSYAAHWFPAVERVASERGWRLVTLLRASCPWVDVTPHNLVLRRANQECRAARAAALDRVAELRPIAAVVANAPDYLAADAPGDPVAPEDWEAGARRTLGALAARGIPTLVVLPTPTMERPVPECLSAVAARGADGACRSPRASALPVGRMEAERRAASGLSGVAVLDVSDRICDPAECFPVRDGRVVFRDRGHLTATFAASLAPTLADRLDALLPPP